MHAWNLVAAGWCAAFAVVNATEGRAWWALMCAAFVGINVAVVML